MTHVGANSGVIIGRDNFGSVVVGGAQSWRPRLHPLAEGSDDEVSRFTYTARRTRFLGRDAEMAALCAFRDRPEPFLWWLVAGAGGMGKSRLALEFCHDTAAIPSALPEPGWWDRLRRRPLPPAPPLWVAGFLDMEDAAGTDDAVELEGRFETVPTPALRELVAKALVNKGAALLQGGDGAAAIAVCDAEEARYGADLQAGLRELVAMALVNKGITLGRGGDGAAEIAVYDAVEARYGPIPCRPCANRSPRRW